MDSEVSKNEEAPEAVELSPVEAKPKRKRRTRAEIEADLAAEAEAKRIKAEQKAAEKAAKEAAKAAEKAAKAAERAAAKAAKAAEKEAQQAAKAAARAGDADSGEAAPVRKTRTAAARKTAAAKDEAAAPEAGAAANLDLILQLAQQAKDAGKIDDATLQATLAALQQQAAAAPAPAAPAADEDDADDNIGNRVDTSGSDGEIDDDIGNRADISDDGDEPDDSIGNKLSADEAAAQAAQDNVGDSEGQAAVQAAGTEGARSEEAQDGEEKKPFKERPNLTPAERRERKARVLAERKAAAARRAREKDERERFLSFLALAFPKAIFVDREQRLPLKVGIAQDILDRLKNMEAQFQYFDKQRYKILHNYCHSLPYLQKIADGVPRVDLDGNPAGEIEEEHRENAKAEIERIRQEIEAATAKAKKSHKAKRPMKPRRPGPGQNRFAQGQRPNFNKGDGQGYNNRYNQGGYQNGGYQGGQGGYQNRQGGYQNRFSNNNGYQGGGYQNNYQNGGYQNNYQNGGYQGQGGYQGGQGGYQNGGYQGGQGGYQNGYNSQGGYRAGGYRTGGGGYQNRFQQTGYQNRFQNNGAPAGEQGGNGESTGPKVMRRRVFNVNKREE